MTRQTMCCPLLTVIAITTLAGCKASIGPEESAQMLPQRPAELDKLKVFEGRWEGSGEAWMSGADEVVPVRGVWQAGRECDGWYLVSREEFEMGESNKTRGIGIWTWDPKRNKYRTWWFGEGGARNSAMTTCDESAKTWTLKIRGQGPAGSIVGRGSVKFVDDNTMEWSWVEWRAWDLLRLFKTLELKGTYERG